MSPSKQKSNERQAARDRKATTRQVASGGTSANAYNPMSGTFHALESITADSGAGYLNGRFKSIDDGEDNASSNGGAGELECMSNNGSYSGESEDQNGKEKQAAGKSGSLSSVVGGADKRDKVRGKNERKHQRQKERRAQELRDKCTGYLMSRKLEALSQQLVAMGFPQERATMALIFNDGHVERSVAWLLEGGEGQVHEDWNSGGNPKIDISEELNYILEIEKKYKFSRPDIERAIVSCEGDLAKALESLRVRSHSLSPGREDGQSAHSVSNDSPSGRKEEPSTSTPAAPPGPGPSQQARSNGAGQPSYQIRKDERGFSQPSKGRQQPSSISTHGPREILTRGSTHPRKLSNSSMEMPSSLLAAERWGHAQATRIPVGAVKTQSPFTSQFTPVSKPHAGLVFGAAGADSKLFPIAARDGNVNTSSKELPNTGQQHILLRASSQPFIGLSTSPAPQSIPSSPAFSSSGRSHGFMDIGSPSSVLYVNAPQGDTGMKEMSVRKKSMKSSDVGVSDMIMSLNALGSFQSEPPTSQWGYAPPNEVSVSPSLNLTMHSRSSSGSGSYGLFTGWGSSFSPSSVDWSTGPMPNCDYRNIDWSMNASPTTLRGVSSRLNSLALQEKGSYFWNTDDERGFHTGLGSASYALESTQGNASWKVGASGPVPQESISLETGSTTAHEWTSPFAGKDLFNLPQAVPSPSL
ncbi:hypothetical protein L7F22_016777 [Adiantum nelumboides]|nr:hypothetical protein [Adiantum nelumboides]